MVVETYLVSRRTGEKFRLNGVRRSTRLPSKLNLRQAFRGQRLYSAAKLPSKVDLRKDMTSVENQGQTNSCTANALAGAYEYLTKKGSGRDIHVSRFFAYYNTRVKDNKGDESNIEDVGATLSSTVEAAEEFGTCLESLWPFDPSNINTRPSDEAYQQGADHQITSASWLDHDLQEMKSCLAQGFPFLFGVTLYPSIEQAETAGVVPIPNAFDYQQGQIGGHALLAVGYSDKSNSFIVRNSWGQDWGDKGYCYFPYDYLTNENLCFDMHIVQKLEANDFGQDYWDNNDSVDFREQ